MTVENQTNKIDATAGNGSSVTWSFSPMVIFSASELEVVTTVIATGVETTRTQGTGSTNWKIAITTFPATGSITYPADEVTPLPSTETLTIRRVLTLEQQTKLNNQGGYLPENVERQFDKHMMIDLQQQEELDRSIRFPVSYTGNIAVTTTAPAADQYLRANSAGTGLEWAAITTADASAGSATPLDVSLSAAATGGAADFAREDHVHLLPTVTVAKGGTGATTAAAARTALDVMQDVFTTRGDILYEGASAEARLAVGSANEFLKSDGTDPTWAKADYPGTKMIPVPAAGMVARTTNGAAVGISETTTNKVMLNTFNFDKDTDEFVQFSLPMPSSWDEGTITVRFNWTATTTGDVVWGAQGVAIGDDDAVDAAFGTAQTVTDSVTLANDLMRTSATSAITIAGTPAAGDTVVIQIYRDANAGGDTLAADAKLLSVEVFITTDAGVDS